MHPNSPRSNPASDIFILKLGSALADLAEMPAWRIYQECEATLLLDLQDMATSVSVAETNYSERLIFMAGMVQGIKRFILRRRDVLNQYKKAKEEGVAHDAGNNTAQPTGTSNTYGHTAGGG